MSLQLAGQKNAAFYNHLNRPHHWMDFQGCTEHCCHLPLALIKERVWTGGARAWTNAGRRSPPRHSSEKGLPTGGGSVTDFPTVPFSSSLTNRHSPFPWPLTWWGSCRERPWMCRPFLKLRVLDFFIPTWPTLSLQHQRSHRLNGSTVSAPGELMSAVFLGIRLSPDFEVSVCPVISIL